MKTKTIICTRCKNPKPVQLKNPIKLLDQHTEYCPNCQTELAFVDGDNFFPKYNLWAIRTLTAKRIDDVWSSPIINY